MFLEKLFMRRDGLTDPWGKVFNTGESSFAPILTVAPPSPTTTYLFLETAGRSSNSSRNSKRKSSSKGGRGATCQKYRCFFLFLFLNEFYETSSHSSWNLLCYTG